MSVRLSLRLAYCIGGLDDQVDEQVLLGVFVPFGEVKEVTIPLDAGTGLKRGFGFVEFEDAEDAAEARDNMNSDYYISNVENLDAELFGRVIKVTYSNRMKPSLISQKPSIDSHFK